MNDVSAREDHSTAHGPRGGDVGAGPNGAVLAPRRGRLAREQRLILLAIWRGVGELYNSEGLTHAASIAYYALLSLFPFLLLVLSVLGSLTADPSDRDAVIGFLFRYFPRQFDFITWQFDAFRSQSVQIGIGGVLMLTWASLGVFNAVSSAINHAWGVEHRRSFLKHRLVSFLMMLSAGGILVIALLLASAAKFSETRWFLSMVERVTWLGWLGGLTVSYAATLLLIACVALVYYFIPNTKIRFRDVWPGAIVTGLLWQGAFSAFSWYARDMARWNAVHGSIAAVVVFLIWIYVCAVILLYGVEVTAAYVRLRSAPALSASPPDDPTSAGSARR